MTAPHGNSNEQQPADLAVYDLRPATPQPALPLPLGQFLLAAGIALILFGLWALASAAGEPSSGRQSAASQSNTDRGDDGANGSGETADTIAPQSEEGEGGSAQFDCNEDRTVCRFTAPNGVETYLCVEPCDLPPWVGDGASVVFLSSDGVGGSDFVLLGDGSLDVLPAGHGEAGFFQFVDDGNGGIELVTIGDGSGISVEFGVLEPRNASDDASADTPEAQPDRSDDSGSGLGLDGLGLGLPGLAPLLLVLGVGLIIIAAVIIQNARKNREDDDIIEDDIHHEGEIADPEDEAPHDDPIATEAHVRVRKINDLIADLHHDNDPARAIQRAYAALETGFGNPTLARRPSETCSTYLHRTIGVVGGVSEPLRRLTHLFELARFSDAVIDETMRVDAIDALSAVRDAWSARGATP